MVIIRFRRKDAREPGSALGARARLGRWLWAGLIPGGVFFFLRPILIQEHNSNSKNNARKPGSALGPRARLGRWLWAWPVQGGSLFLFEADFNSGR